MKSQFNVIKQLKRIADALEKNNEYLVSLHKLQEAHFNLLTEMENRRTKNHLLNMAAQAASAEAYKDLADTFLNKDNDV